VKSFVRNPRLIDIARVLTAYTHIDPVFLNSPLFQHPALDVVLGCQVVCKVETLNPIRSFKGRGAELYVATELRAGETMVCASAGNFGQGLAYSATRRGYTCIVFAAETANTVKVEAMRRLGADVHLVRADFDQAKEAARGFAHQRGFRFVEDGAEPTIAEGAGTIGVELTASAGNLDAVTVPLGDGALLSGIGAAIRHLAPRIEIIGVVAEKAPALQLSLAAGRIVETADANTIADGIAGRVPVPEALALLDGLYDSIVAVTEAQIVAGMRLAHQHLGLVVEPSAAVGLAAVMADPHRFHGKRIATILTGSNISTEMRERLIG
jgi:threonine dehydratase